MRSTATTAPKRLTTRSNTTEGFAGHDGSSLSGTAAAAGAALRLISRICASTTRVIGSMKTKVPMTLMRGLTWPCRKPSTLHRQRLVEARDEPGDGELVEGHGHGDEQRGEDRRPAERQDDVAHRHPFDAPRFQAAASSDGSICDSRSRMIAMANGAHITTWAMMTE